MAIHQLQYGRQGRLYRRVIRRVLFFISLAAMAVGLFYLLRTRVMMWRRQIAFQPVRQAMFEQCLNHTYPARTLIFDEAVDAVSVPMYSDAWRLSLPRPSSHPVEMQSNGWGRFHWPINWTQNEPTTWNRLASLDEVYYADPFRVKCASNHQPAKYYSQKAKCSDGWADDLFSQARRSSDGQHRLLLLGFDPPAFIAGSDTPFRVQVASISGTFHRIRIKASPTAFDFHFDCPSTQPLQLYAGQADPADESHCTIDYATPAGAGVIDAWLLPGDQVKMSVRNGPATGSQTPW